MQLCALGGGRRRGRDQCPVLAALLLGLPPGVRGSLFAPDGQRTGTAGRLGPGGAHLASLLCDTDQRLDLSVLNRLAEVASSRPAPRNPGSGERPPEAGPDHFRFPSVWICVAGQRPRVTSIVPEAETRLQAAGRSPFCARDPRRPLLWDPRALRPLLSSWY